MTRFVNGYIKLHRRTVHQDIGSSGVRLAVWVTLLCWAMRFEGKIPWKGGQRTVPPGSVLTGIRELARHLGFSKDAVSRALRALVSRDSIRTETATRGTLITICNWAKYQNIEDEAATPELQKRDTTETLAGHEPDLIGEVENKERRNAEVERERSSCGPVTELAGNELLDTALKGVNERLQRTWVQTYPDQDWLRQEIQKAASWIEANPKRRPKKSLARFIGAWLARGWDRHRLTMPKGQSAPDHFLSADELDRIQAEFNGTVTHG